MTVRVVWKMVRRYRGCEEEVEGCRKIVEGIRKYVDGCG